MELTINQPKIIKVNYCDLLHRPSTVDFFSINFKYKSNGNVLSFQFNVAKNHMEVTFHDLIANNEIHKLQFNKDLSQLTFDVSVTPFKTYCLIASTPIEMAIFNVINLLHNKGLPKPITEQDFNYSKIQCRTKMGKIELISVDNTLQLQDTKTKVTQITSYDFIIEMMKEIIQTKKTINSI